MTGIQRTAYDVAISFGLPSKPEAIEELRQVSQNTAMLAMSLRNPLPFICFTVILFVLACGVEEEPTPIPAPKPPPAPPARPAAATPSPTPAATPAPTAPSPEAPETSVKPKQYSAPPPLTINPNKDYKATIHMEKGDEIVMQLFPQEAPVTVNSFVFLARDGYYDGVTFHRVIPGLKAHSGDPTGTGQGGPGYTFDNEFSLKRWHDAPGVLSRTIGTNGSQFFITLVASPSLDGFTREGDPRDCGGAEQIGTVAFRVSCHTVFGRVIKGMDVVNSISPRDPLTATTPGDAIRTITIEEGE